MTTQTYTDVIDHTSNAGFQAWSDTLHLAIIAAGLVNTSDTGQVDLTTAARPGLNSWAGYKTYRFNDTMQGTRPVFLKMEFGTGSATTTPALRVTIGEATDGAGTLSGATLLSNLTINQSGQPLTSTVTPYTTRICAVDGFFGLAFGLGSTGTTSPLNALLTMGRSVDSSGSPNGDGLHVCARPSTATGALSYRALQYTTGNAYTMTSGSSSLIAGGLTNSLVGGAAQVFKHYIPLPRVRPIPWLLTVLSSEIGNNVEFEATAVGALQRNYVSLGSEAFNASANLVALPNAAGQTLAMVWE